MKEKSTTEPVAGLSRMQARLLEFSIIGLCLIALILVFQPYSLKLYSVGAVLVVIGGLAFNIVPFCRQGVTVATLLRVTATVIVLLFVIAGLAIGSAWLYGQYVTTST